MIYRGYGVIGTGHWGNLLDRIVDVANADCVTCFRPASSLSVVASCPRHCGMWATSRAPKPSDLPREVC